jgi:hypothetical protein
MSPGALGFGDLVFQANTESAGPTSSFAMNADPAQKTCRMCCLDIPTEARKCPHCHHFQNRWALVLYHPALAATFAILPMIIMLTIVVQMFDQGEPYQWQPGQIEITGSEVVFGDSSSNATVAVLGTITNTSAGAWREIHFHVDFSDATGRRVDVGQREQYSLVLPGHAALSFKVSFRREFPETNYVQHQIRVVSAKDARVRW